MGTRTFAGATISIATALPATYDATGYAALTWKEHCVDALPAINKVFSAVSKSTTCQTPDTDIKGSSKYEPLTYNFDPADNEDAETLYQAAFDSQTAVVPIRIKFSLREGETTAAKSYNTAQVAKFAITNGGSKDDIDLKAVELWLQREFVNVEAA